MILTLKTNAKKYNLKIKKKTDEKGKDAKIPGSILYCTKAINYNFYSINEIFKAAYIVHINERLKTHSYIGATLKWNFCKFTKRATN